MTSLDKHLPASIVRLLLKTNYDDAADIKEASCCLPALIQVRNVMFPILRRLLSEYFDIIDDEKLDFVIDYEPLRGGLGITLLELLAQDHICSNVFNSHWVLEWLTNVLRDTAPDIEKIIPQSYYPEMFSIVQQICKNRQKYINVSPYVLLFTIFANSIRFKSEHQEIRRFIPLKDFARFLFDLHEQELYLDFNDRNKIKVITSVKTIYDYLVIRQDNLQSLVYLYKKMTRETTKISLAAILMGSPEYAELNDFYNRSIGDIYGVVLTAAMRNPCCSTVFLKQLTDAFLKMLQNNEGFHEKMFAALEAAWTELLQSIFKHQDYVDLMTEIIIELYRSKKMPVLDMFYYTFNKNVCSWISYDNFIAILEKLKERGAILNNVFLCYPFLSAELIDKIISFLRVADNTEPYYDVARVQQLRQYWNTLVYLLDCTYTFVSRVSFIASVADKILELICLVATSVDDLWLNLERFGRLIDINRESVLRVLQQVKPYWQQQHGYKEAAKMITKARELLI